MNTPLRSLLSQRGLRLKDLAEKAKVDKATVTRWAQGRFPPERALEVERLTGIPREDLLPDLYRHRRGRKQ